MWPGIELGPPAVESDARATDCATQPGPMTKEKALVFILQWQEHRKGNYRCLYNQYSFR